MKCLACDGDGVAYTIVQEDGSEVSENCGVCGGNGEVPDESAAYGNDCPKGNCDV